MTPQLHQQQTPWPEQPAAFFPAPADGPPPAPAPQHSARRSGPSAPTSVGQPSCLAPIIAAQLPAVHHGGWGSGQLVRKVASSSSSGRALGGQAAQQDALPTATWPWTQTQLQPQQVVLSRWVPPGARQTTVLQSASQPEPALAPTPTPVSALGQKTLGQPAFGQHSAGNQPASKWTQPLAPKQVQRLTSPAPAPVQRQQQRQQQPQQRVPKVRKQLQQGKAVPTVKHGKYGAGTSFVFEPGMPPPAKPKAQVTLQETLERHAQLAVARNGGVSTAPNVLQQQRQDMGAAEWAASLAVEADEGGLSSLDSLPMQQTPAARSSISTAAAPQLLRTTESWGCTAGGGDGCALPGMHLPIFQPAEQQLQQQLPVASQVARWAHSTPGTRGHKQTQDGGAVVVPVAAAARRARAQLVLTGPLAAVDYAAEGRRQQQQRWPWLADRRDADGRAPDDPAFDPRTIAIPQSAWSGELQGVWGQARLYRQQRVGSWPLASQAACCPPPSLSFAHVCLACSSKRA